MARIELSFPDDVFCFETRMQVRITDINSGNHLGNDALISMLSEARAQFLLSYGVSEGASSGQGIIVTGTWRPCISQNRSFRKCCALKSG